MSVKTIYDGNISEGTAKNILAGAGASEEKILSEIPFEWGDGVDSAVLKTPSDEARANTVSGDWSVAMGSRNEALGKECFVVGGLSTAGAAESAPGADDGANDCAAIGYRVKATGENSFATGYRTKATGKQAFAQGKYSKASGANSHAEGSGNSENGENEQTIASGDQAHAEGWQTQSTAWATHSEGSNTKATSEAAHAEGKNTVASASKAHAEGSGTVASAEASHAENRECTASGANSHAGGLKSAASGADSFAHGDSCFAKHVDSIVLGTNNASTRDSQTVVGRWSSDGNGENSGVDTTALFAVGAGNWNRVGECCLQAGYGNVDETGVDKHYIKIGNTVLTEAQLIALLASLQ